MSDSSSNTVTGAEGAAAVATTLYCNVPSVMHRVVALQSPAHKAVSAPNALPLRLNHLSSVT